jgi:hypothetical protein
MPLQGDDAISSSPHSKPYTERISRFSGDDGDDGSSELESEIRRFSFRKETALYGLIPVFSSSR